MKKAAKRRSAKQLRAIQTSRHLHMAQHRHTGHLIHRRHTSYPTLVMIVLCVGVLLASWTHLVTADFPGPITNAYTVHASVPGPAPSQPATIDSPAPGTTFTDLPITVSGSCPLNTYETLYRNGAFSGVALCDASGHYELQTGLFPGANKLEVRDFSQTDVPGPLSNAVMVTYQPPVPPAPTGSGSTTSSGQGSTRTGTSTGLSEPLIFKTTFNYQGQYVGEKMSWQIDIEGGAAPYAISVDWGDGQHSLLSRAKAGTFTVEHTYKQAGGYRGSYKTLFSASDADGNQTFLQLLAIVNNPPAGVAHTHRNGPNVTLLNNGDLSHLMKYIWPGYGIVVLMLTSFWLGERREFQHLKPLLRKRRHA